MKTSTRSAFSVFVGLLSAVGVCARPSMVFAQPVDTNPPLPNVLLLIDNSGSMDRMIDGTLPEDTPANACDCNATTGACTWVSPASPNRWGLMAQAMTGNFSNGYHCAAMPRTPGSIFAQEYQIGGVAPYDINYYLPFHRPIAKDTTTATQPMACVYAPGTLPGAVSGQGVGPTFAGAGGNATDFPSGAIVTHSYGVQNTTACAFAQDASGALDTARDLMRFGLMTFDQDPSPGIGVTTGPSPQVLSPPFNGMWSYFPGWNTGAACTYYGNPANCMTQDLFAVGARNPAAPPWEGRMMLFPSTNDITAQEQGNDQIQQVIMATRPYGATPLAGMMVGAQYYFWTDPKGPQQTDGYVQGKCRNEFIIVITDGAPNLDLQPSCSAAGAPPGHCPFPAPDVTAKSLYQPAANSNQQVVTYVLGFAVSSFTDQGTLVNCSNLVTNGTLSTTCNSTDPTVQAMYGPCCELQLIALSGGSGHAYFADTPGDLNAALGSILADIAKNATTRTTPAYSPVTTNVVANPDTPVTNASIFLASFTPSVGSPWSGDVQRQRYDCTYTSGGGGDAGSDAGAKSGYTVPPASIDVTKGDDFATNLNQPGATRTFYAFMPDNSLGPANASGTIRPYVAPAVGDGIGQYKATTIVGAASSVIPMIGTDALGVTNTSCGYTPIGGTTVQYLSAADCRTMLLDYSFAQPTFTGSASNFPFVSRSGNAFGDVYDAIPIAVGPPGSLLEDDSYVAFRNQYATREQDIYVATNDGLLHAFWADVATKTNNERWALMPPAVMPNILSSYPSSHQFLLDGSPIVRDVPWTRSQGGDAGAVSANWRTTLVASYGSYQRGYYALDVTNPCPGCTSTTTSLPTGSLPNNEIPDESGQPAGPLFLWQLTTMPSGNAPLFASQSATPAITSVAIIDSVTGLQEEVGVAILPGGQDQAPSSSAQGCPRAVNIAGSSYPTSDATPLNGFKARTSVRSWSSSCSAPVVGRSVSVVRLDTGEILAVFMRKADVPATDTLIRAVPSRIIDTPLDSPMTGTPIVYPNDVGTDATKFFIGDADGSVWRFDLSNPDFTQWKGELFLDLYNQTADTSANALSDGQPIQVSPVLSVDPAAHIVLNIASGSQQTFNTTATNFLYSVTEEVQSDSSGASRLRAVVNWYLGPSATSLWAAGECVSGPMTVFDGVLYFATYAAPAANTAVCSGGTAKLWGLDYVNPLDPSDLSQGGAKRLQPPAGQDQTLTQFITPSTIDSSLTGKVIPGVSINATPACADLGAADAGTVGSNSVPQNFTPGSYSLFTQIGAQGSGGASTKQINIQVPTPTSPTLVDSWAAVTE
jgi:type IV pilus assembly protein PilY1